MITQQMFEAPAMSRHPVRHSVSCDSQIARSTRLIEAHSGAAAAFIFGIEQVKRSGKNNSRKISKFIASD